MVRSLHPASRLPPPVRPSKAPPKLFLRPGGSLPPTLFRRPTWPPKLFLLPGPLHWRTVPGAPAGAFGMTVAATPPAQLAIAVANDFRSLRSVDFWRMCGLASHPSGITEPPRMDGRSDGRTF
eukprot:1459503-Prymnesium_polylepis.1